MKKSRRLFSFLALLIATTFCLSLVSYYWQLGRVGTIDEPTTLNRIKLFRANYQQVELINGSHLTFILSATFGRAVNKALLVLGWTNFTEYQPYLLVNTSLALILIVLNYYLVHRISKSRLSLWHPFSLLIMLFLLNFPMLKGLSKILKYDSLSLLFSLLALNLFVLGQKEPQKPWRWTAFLTASLAFLEKDTAFSTFIFLLLASLSFLVINSSTWKALLRESLKLFFFIPLIYFLPMYFLVPKLWSSPREILTFFSSLKQYGVIFNLPVVLLGMTLIIATFALKRHLTALFEKVNWKITLGSLSVGLIALFLLALAWQKNQMVYLDLLKPRELNQLTRQGYYQTPTMANVNITTYDFSPWMTRLRLLFDEWRLFVYTVPEVVVLFMVFSPGAYYLGKKSKFSSLKWPIFLYSGFIVFHVLAYAYLLVPIEAKYLNLVFSTVILLFMLLAWQSLELLPFKIEKNRWFLLSLILITLTQIQTLSSQSPSYFGYLSAFRSRTVENSEFLKKRYYTFWTWAGWGETNFLLQQSLPKSQTPIVIAYDYLAPFAVRQDVTYIPASLQTIQTQSELKRKINQLRKEKANYLFVSKNMANRFYAPNLLVKRFRQQAILTDKRDGIEYGWAFKVQDLLF